MERGRGKREEKYTKEGGRDIKQNAKDDGMQGMTRKKNEDKTKNTGEGRERRGKKAKEERRKMSPRRKKESSKREKRGNARKKGKKEVK